MKTCRIFLLALFLLLTAQQFPALAVDTLVATTDFPSTIDGNTAFAKGEFSLPSSVILSSNSVVKWSFIEPSFSNEQGDAYVPQGGIWASPSPFSIKIEPLGRRSIVNFYSVIAVKTKVTIVAQVDSKSFSITREIDFKSSTSGSVNRVELPKLPSGFKVELENPDPGADLQTIIRSRVVFDGPWATNNFALVWIDKNGQAVETGGSTAAVNNGQWKQFKVSADDYRRYGFTLNVAWSLPIPSSTASAIFQRQVPVNINFKTGIAPNTYAYDDVFFQRYVQYENKAYIKLNFICPANLDSKASTYKCTIQAFADFDKTVLKQAGYDENKSYALSGQIPARLCTYSNENDPLYGSCGYQDDKAKTTINLLIGFDKPITVTVNNYLSTTGYTYVELDIFDSFKNFSPHTPVVSPQQNYAWSSSNYEAQKKKASIPSTTYQKSLATWIRKSMINRCQVLPKAFSGYSITYSKNITSSDGVPGYLFKINKTVTVQVFPDMYLIAPSFAPADVLKWKNWGCGGNIFSY